MKQTMYELREQILKLSSDERANLLALVEHEEMRAPYNASREDRDLWQILGNLADPGTVHRSLDAFLRDKQRGLSRPAWAAALDTIGKFVKQAGMRHAGQDKLLTGIVLECLAADMAAQRQEVSPKSLLGALGRLRLAVDRAYPGYLEAGLLYRLVPVAAE